MNAHMKIQPSQPALLDEPDAPSASLEEDIAVRAYFKAEARGFEPGHDLDDWLAAESEIALGEMEDKS